MPKLNADSALQLDHQLCFALYSASLAMTKLYTPLLSALKLTYPQYLVLLVLWEQDGMSVTALGERLHLNSGTLTPLLKRMEASGLLVRARSQEDERRVLVSLTAEGKKLKARAAAIPPCVAEATDCSLSELMALTHQLKALRNRLNHF
ncbi:MAG: MarR family transcriptional regulator [Burkholderiales bacterium PBB3]|nr:MAG: MarR family transcriptional regulator [Burkholderiales bacterium PBB3]